ncbi:MAG: molybdopterin biosynthesis protein [Desulfopila sp.]
MRTIYVKNTPLAEARHSWHQALVNSGFFQKTFTETIPVDECLGRITAAPVFAGHSAPAHNAAAMDGIAVHFASLAAASEAAPVILAKEQFLQVNTGNAIPQNFNAVVMIEDVHILENGDAMLHQPATPWQHIRTIGEDIVATELILPEGHRIRPIDQGAMLATGVTDVTVSKRPRALVIPTGSELIPPGSTPQPGEIIEFNSRILAGYLQEWGAEAVRAQPVTDDPELLRQTLIEAASTSDLVVLNAGASAGTRDYSATVLAEIGQVVVHGVAIKPGKPVILAFIGDTPVIGLPGYPVSAVLTMRLFVRPMLGQLLDRYEDDYGRLEATMSRPVASTMGVDEFVRITLGRVGDTLMATPAGKGAGAVMSLVRADGLLTIPAGSEGVGAGEKVSIELLRAKTEVEATLVVIGSHDNILDLIANTIHHGPTGLRISSAHVGSMGGIMAIRRGEAHTAGCHLLDTATGEYNIPFIKRLLASIPLQLVNLCYREQGLIIARGNPKGITGFTDLVAKQLTFINRQNGAGTRLLTDKVMGELHIQPEQLAGYEHEEYTHMSVAAAVASGAADAGMGIRAAAVALDCDFVPVAEERYDLIIPTAYASDDKVVALLELIRNDSEFHRQITALGGYDLRDIGTVMYQQ